jgi:hypothetical protein
MLFPVRGGKRARESELDRDDMIKEAFLDIAIHSVDVLKFG